MPLLPRPLAAATLRLRRRLSEPLLVASLAAITGILLADAGLYAAVSAIAAIVLGCGFAIWSRDRAFLLLAVTGAFALAHDQHQQAMLSLPFADQLLHGEQLLVEAEGVIDTIPKAAADSRSGRVSFFVRLGRIRQLGGSPLPSSQRLFVTANLDPPPLYGDRLLLAGRLRTPPPPRNPGEFDFGRYLERKGVIAQLAAEDLTGARVLSSGHGNPLMRWADGARRWVARAITRDLAQRDPEIAGVLTAMTLGTRADARDELIDSFRTSGTLHIFAVSGLHVGLIGIILWHLLTPLPIGRRSCALAIIVVLCAYAFVTGLRPSAVRATAMACLVLGGPLLGREPRVVNSLGAAGLLILAWDSNQLFLPGFQLSFAVLLSLTLLHRPILALLLPLASPDPFLPRSLLTGGQRIYYKFARALADTFAISFAAWAGSLPLMLHHFHLVTPVAPIANLFLIPLAFCILGTAILSTLASGIGWLALTTIFNNANFFFASTLAGAAACFAKLPVPASHFYAGTPAALRPPCEITVLDLPRGGASTLISTQAGGDWLIDTGGARDFRPSISAVLHQHAGVTHIDRLLLSHADAGHIGAAAEVVATFRPGTVYPPPPNRASSAFRSLAAQLELLGAVTLTLRQDEPLALDGHTSIQALFLPSDPRPRSSDDACIVFLLCSHGWRILFTGDAGYPTEATLLESHRGSLGADLIIRGNHASDYSCTPDFLAAVGPAAIVVNERDFRDASPGEHIWRKTAAQRGIEVFDQAQTGAVTIGIRASRLEVRSHLSGQSLTLKRAR